jgi:hypothetical protein
MNAFQGPQLRVRLNRKPSSSRGRTEKCPSKEKRLSGVFNHGGVLSEAAKQTQDVGHVFVSNESQSLIYGSPQLSLLGHRAFKNVGHCGRAYLYIQSR